MSDAAIIKIGVVDDHNMFRTALCNLLEGRDHYKIVLLASNGEEMKSRLSTMAELPDVILMDINMPVLNGFYSTAWLTEHYPLIRVLALTMNDDELSIIKMIRSGASGFILKESDVKELDHAIQTIYDKGVYLNELVTGRFLYKIQHNQIDTATISEKVHITEKEKEFLNWSATDMTYKEIAEKLKVSPRTVDNYRESLFAKMQVRSRTGLVMVAIRTGLLQVH